uniref:Protein sleepless n=1 Tax=Anopheles epiroticus TaxID=199890 RepID=A0A182PJ45_9DIPT
MKSLPQRAIFALVILCIQQALSLQCYVCLSAVSFDDCSSKAMQVDCDSPPPDLPFPFAAQPMATNVAFACGKGSGSDRSGQIFVKTCVPKMSEAEFCALLTTEVGDTGKVDVCKVCNDNLCNVGSVQVLTGALLLFTVGLILRV